MTPKLIRFSLVGLFVTLLASCAVVRVADTVADAAVFAGTTAVRGVAATGRVVTGTGRDLCPDGARRRRC